MNVTDQLRSLPAVESRPGGWPDVRRRLVARQVTDSRRTVVMRLVAAASIAIIAVTATWQVSELVTEPPSVLATELTPLTAEQALALDRVAQLQTRSQALEDMLLGLGERPVVQRAGSSLPIDTLEAQVQWLDHQISYGDDDIEPGAAERLWRKRVEAMNSLVQLRYVEAQRIDM